MTQQEIIYKGFFDCAKKIYRKEGIMVFTNGSLYRTFYAGSMNLIFFVFYEYSREFFYYRLKKN